MKITVIGENCTDVFVYCDVKRLSPEAPIPVLNPNHTESNPGMAGNVVENLFSLNSDLDISFIGQTEDIIKTRYVEEKSNHMFIRVDEETKVSLLELTDEMIQEIEESDAVIVSDYNKGFLNEEVLLKIANHAKFIVMDTKKHISEHTISNFNFIKLNEIEYSKFDKDTKEIYAEKLLATLGSRGARYMNKDYPSPNPKETIDVSGAGDTFTSAFTLKYLETKNIDESITFANEMASIVVSKRGVSTPK